MSLRNTLLCSTVILAMPFTAAFAYADALIIETAPPPVQSETVPAERTGYIWAPGYQRWTGDHFEWVPGHYVEARLHSHWVPDSWEKIGDNRWQYREGHWETD